jgi:hypothetical protein
MWLIYCIAMYPAAVSRSQETFVSRKKVYGYPSLSNIWSKWQCVSLTKHRIPSEDVFHVGHMHVSERGEIIEGWRKLNRVPKHHNLYPVKHYWESKGERKHSSYRYSFLASAVDGVSGQRHALAALYPWKRIPDTHWTGGLVGLGAGLDTEARGKILYLCWGSISGCPVCSLV